MTTGRCRHGSARSRALPAPALAVVVLTVMVLATAGAVVVARPAQAGARSAAGPSASPNVSARSGLSVRERAASLVLARDRARFLARYADDPDRPFTTSFLSFRRELHASALFRALQTMPKGGLLHVHASGIGDALWVVDRALTEPHTYVYWGDDGGGSVHGELAVYPRDDAPAGFVSAALLRQSVPDLRVRLFRLITLGPEDATAPDIWTEFEAIFQRLDAFVSYKPVFVDYYRRSFLTLARDGVQFVEIHTSVDELSTASGGTVEDLGVLAAYRRALAGVRAYYPSFGLRIIMCTWRGATLEEAAAQLARERALSAAAPGIVHGFDIVAHEDGGNSNGFYAPVLAGLPCVPLYLHAGESLSAADTNIQDALDMGAERIGHGLNMDLFPGLEQRVRAAGVTVEVCPVSNQTLRYVPDLRRHPARGWLRRGTRVALGSDDPSIFGTSGLSDDFAMAYLSWRLSLSKLKQLALRSIGASTLPRDRRERQRALFERRWDRWVAALASGPAAAR
jgi:adenosine deaminase CECR1